MHYCSNFFEANLLLTAVTFLGVTVTAVIFFVNAEGYEAISRLKRLIDFCFSC